MDCPTLEGLRFDAQSQEGIRRIRRIYDLSDMLAAALGVGVFVNIFAGSSVPEAAYNIYGTDWRLFSEAVSAIPAIQRRAIRTEAVNQAWIHQNSPTQRRFWEAIADGCRIP